MSRLPLGCVTLCAVDGEAPALSLLALVKAAQALACERVVLFTDRWLPRVVLPGIEIVDVGPLASPPERSAFVVRGLGRHVRTSHALLLRWDAGIVNPGAWSDEFLVHDWLGDGGCSLRSRRLLLAGDDPRLRGDPHPEPEAITTTWRPWLQQHHGVSYAPEPLARRFVATEADRVEPWQFACAGAHHLATLLDAADLVELVPRLPREAVASPALARLEQALRQRGLPAVAEMLAARRAHDATGPRATLPSPSASGSTAT